MFGNYDEQQEAVEAAQQDAQYEQQASFQDPNLFLNTQRMKELQNLALWELNPQEIMERLERHYKGEILVDDKWVKKFPGFMTDEAAAQLLSVISIHVNKVNFLNDYEDHEINHRASQLRRAVANWLRTNYKEAKIDKRNFDFILLPTDNLVYGAYKKSLKGGERRFLGTVHNTTENTLRNGMPPKKFMGLFPVR